MLNAMVWIARSRAPWLDLPERFGPWETVYSRFRKWIDNGFLDNIFRILSLDAELSEISIDVSIVQAHQHSAGARKDSLPNEIGRSRGGTVNASFYVFPNDNFSVILDSVSDNLCTFVYIYFQILEMK